MRTPSQSYRTPTAACNNLPRIRKRPPLLESLESRELFSTFTVTNTLDSGPGTLRQAITDANANAGLDTIDFHVGGGGIRKISPTSALPDITDPVILNGTTQTPYAGTPLVQIDAQVNITVGGNTIRGLSFTSPNGIPGATLTFNGGSGSTIAGNYFGVTPAGDSDPSDGISMNGSTNNVIGGTSASDRNVIDGQNFGLSLTAGSAGNVISGNYIGTDPTGMTAQGSSGITIDSSSNNTIGGTAPGAGNLISGHLGIRLQSGDGTVIQGNLIGTDVTGTRVPPNTFGVPSSNITGIEILAGDNTLIGGTTPGARNVISGNQVGIAIGADYFHPLPIASVTIQGNFIGTDITGTQPIPNENGIGIGSAQGSNVLIGGTTPGTANVIAFNDFKGVSVGDASGVRILGNSIYSNQFNASPALGIDLGGDGVTPNDPSTDVGDADTGPNGLQNFPVITAADATSVPGTTIISFTLNSGISTDYRIEFFANAAADPSGYGEGQTYLGSTDVKTDDFGAVSFNTPIHVAAPGQFITATATNISPASADFNSTSEFSADFQATGGPVAPPPPPGGLPMLSIAGVSAAEGDSGATDFNFPVTLSASSATDVTVQYGTAPGTADASDYTPASATLTIPAGQTAGTITVHVSGDTAVEPDEVFTVNLSSPTGASIATGTATGTILNDDLGGTPAASSLAARIIAKVPASVIAGQPAKNTSATVTVINQGQTTLSNPVTIRLVVSPDTTLDSSDTQVTTTTKVLKLKPGQSKATVIKIPSFPAVPDGQYFLLADVTTAGDPGTSAASATPFTIAAPFVDLVPTSPVIPAAVKHGAALLVPLTVRNAGNIAAAGPISVHLFASADAIASDDDQDLGIVTTSINLKPDAAKALKFRGLIPNSLPAGTYHLITTIDAANQFPESDETNNTVASSNTFTVS